MRFAETDAAMNEKRIVRAARLFADGDRCGVRQAIAGAGHEMIEGVIGIEQHGLLALVKNAAAREIFAVKTHGDQSARHLLRGRGKRLLTLALAEIQLCRGGDDHLNDAVGQLPWDELIEPDTIEAWMLGAQRLKNVLPDSWIDNGSFLRAAGGGLARRRRVGRGHFLTSLNRDPMQRHVRQKSAGRKCFINICSVNKTCRRSKMFLRK